MKIGKACCYCGTCVAVCPSNALELCDCEVVVFNEKSCIKCRACEKACPVGAIEV
ncbi:MAG: 4Fe-4S ferredoxin [Candidatus Hydrothermarchaeota archaeon]|nr:MAG: 4Fe-4S ferredoxin [Candidatus Hydrothermarchaeota archaeon]